MKFFFYSSLSLLIFSNLIARDIAISDPIEKTTRDSSLKSDIKIGKHEKYGEILTDGEGRTLYMYTPDINYTSKCNMVCSAIWPPYLLNHDTPIADPSIEGTLGVTKREDYTSQALYNGMPLYHYIRDKKAGDALGQGNDNKWFVISPISGPIKDKKEERQSHAQD